MKNTRFSGDMEKGVRVSFSRGTNEFSSLPSWAFFSLGLKKKPFKNLKTIPNRIFYEYCLHLGLLWFQPYFRFWDCFFFSTRWKKKTVQIIAPSLFPGSIVKNVYFRKQKKTIPLWYNRGIFQQIWIWVEQPWLGLFKRNHTRSPVQFCSFFSITKRLSFSAEL